MIPNQASLTLYTRQGCHLCTEMQQAVVALQAQYGFSLNIVDIDADTYLQMRYNERVPVLTAGEQELCHYHFSADLVLAYFKQKRYAG